MAKRFPGSGPLSTGTQSALLTSAHPTFKCIRRGRRYAWRGEIQPTTASMTYTVRVEYELGKPPAVFVESPALERREGEKIPHLYSEERLCLYLPGAGEWKSDLPIATTIILWTYVWLYHYEVWHVTGRWLGGGHEPDRPKTKEPSAP